MHLSSKFNLSYTFNYTFIFTGYKDHPHPKEPELFTLFPCTLNAKFEFFEIFLFINTNPTVRGAFNKNCNFSIFYWSNWTKKNWLHPEPSDTLLGALIGQQRCFHSIFVVGCTIFWIMKMTKIVIQDPKLIVPNDIAFRHFFIVKRSHWT